MSQRRSHGHGHNPLGAEHADRTAVSNLLNRSYLPPSLIALFIAIGLIWLAVSYSYVSFERLQRTNARSGDVLPSSASLHGSVQEKRATSVCDTEICHTVSNALNRTINRDVDPCDDFYGFVCDGWRKRHPFEQSSSKVSPFSMLASKIASVMQRGLGTSRWGQQNLQEILSGGHANASFGPSVQVATFHQACLGSLKNDQEEQAKKHLRGILGQAGLTALLSTDELSKYDEIVTPSSAIETLVALSLTWGLPSLLTVYVIPDPSATSRNILVISASDQPDREHLRRARPFVADIDDLDTYYEQKTSAMHDMTMELVQNSRIELTKMSSIVAVVANLLNIVSGNERPPEEVSGIAREIVMASLILENSRNHSSSLLSKFANHPRRVKFKDLKYLVRGTSFDLLATINKYVKEHNGLQFTAEEELIVDSPRSLALLSTLLSNVETERAIKNYIAYSLVALLVPFVGNDARRRGAALARALGKDQPKFSSNRWCDLQAMEFLPLSYGAVFVTEMLDAATKTEAQVVVDYIKVAFAEAMRENPWMDHATKLRAMNKLSLMTAHVGFPDWFEENLDKYIEAPDIKAGQLFLDVVLRIKQRKVSKALENFRKPNARDVDSWNFSPASLNAFYEHSRNSITIPAAVLLFPFFTKGGPPAFNYGSLGSIIGHEISHGFDTIGSNFDEEGNYIAWWTKGTKKKFDERNSCFIKQYESLQHNQTAESAAGADAARTSKKHRKNKAQSTGFRTLPENLADNAGLRQAFRAYKYFTRDHETDVVLPGLEFSADQLFFIGNAYKWCANIESRIGELISPEDVHSTERLRCNAATMNIRTFQDVFECRSGAAMAPDKRCVTW